MRELEFFCQSCTFDYLVYLFALLLLSKLVCMMSRHPDNFTEEELLRISRPVDPSILPKGRDSDWIKSDDGKYCQGSLDVYKMHQFNWYNII